MNNQEDPTGKTTEETTVVTTEETTVEPPRETTKTTYRCNNCGATVVPAQVETPTGPRNQCPNCGKMMKLVRNKSPPSPLEKEKKETLWKEDVEPTEVLRSILENHPDVTPSQVGEIMDWAKYGLIEPYVLTQLLASMKGMTDRRAALIGYKYQMALSKIQGRRPLPFPNFVMGLQQQGGGTLPFLPMSQSWDRQPSPQGGSPGADGGMSEERVLKLLDGREKKIEEKKKENALMQTLSGIKQGFDNLHERVSNIEQNGLPAKTGEKVKNPLQEQVDVALGKRLSSVILGEEPTLEKLKIIAKEIKGSAPALAPGSRNQYDMEVEKATHNAEARKAEAVEKRKGYEAIGGGIRDGFASLGWNIGAGASGGPTRSGPSPEAQTEARAPAAEPQPMEWRDGLWYTRCAYSDCHAPMAFEDGKSTVMCPSCRRVIQVQPTEEELKQKISIKKSKTPETKAEVKGEESSGAEEPKGAEGPDVKAAEKVEGVTT